MTERTNVVVNPTPSQDQPPPEPPKGEKPGDVPKEPPTPGEVHGLQPSDKPAGN